LDAQTEAVAAWVEANGFSGQVGQTCVVPTDGGGIAMALAGAGSEDAQARGRFLLAAAAPKLPSGVYKIASDHDQEALREHALGWLLSQYSFERYKAAPPRPKLRRARR